MNRNSIAIPGILQIYAANIFVVLLFFNTILVFGGNIKKSFNATVFQPVHLFLPSGYQRHPYKLSPDSRDSLQLKR